MLASAGDVNGDGRPDFAVTTPNLTLGSLQEAGRVQMFSGKDGTLLWTRNGEEGGAQFGSRIAACGDLDGDGVRDFGVGAPGASPGGKLGAGGVRLLSGKTGAVLLTIEGRGKEEWFGTGLDGAGDLDGDGMPDLVVGAPHAHPKGFEMAGRVTAVSGRDGKSLWVAEGQEKNEFLGWEVARLGDVNGDGTDDFGASGWGGSPGGRHWAGVVRVISGKDGKALRSIEGEAAEEQSGYSLASAGDVNGDGVADILIGAIMASPPAKRFAGRAYVCSGKDGTRLLTLDGTPVNGAFGWSVCGVGDWNGDGRADVVVGDRLAQPGEGSHGGQVRVFSGKDGSVLKTLDASGPGEWFGSAILGPGDLNGDGVPDLVVGAPATTLKGLDYAGKAVAISGKDGTVLYTLLGIPDTDVGPPK